MEELLRFVIALTCFMAANVITGVIKANVQETFEWKTLLNGVLKYVLWLVSFILGVIAIGYFPDLEIQIGEEIVTLAQGIELLELTIIGVYAVKFFKNCYEYHEINKEVKEVDYGTTASEASKRR